MLRAISPRAMRRHDGNEFGPSVGSAAHIPAAPIGLRARLGGMIQMVNPPLGREVGASSMRGPTGLVAESGQTSLGLQFVALLYVFSTPLDLVPLPFGSPVMATGLLFLVSWAVALLRGRVCLPRGAGLPLILSGMIVWSFVTVFWSYAPSVSMIQSVTTLTLALSAVAVSGVFSGDAVRPAIAMALGSAFAGLAAMVSGPEAAGSAVGVDPQRATFLSVDQNALAFHISLGMAAALFVLLRVRGLGRRSLLLVTVAVQTAALIVVGSRTGVGVGLALAVAYFLLSLGQPRRALVALGVLAAVVLVVGRISALGLLPDRVLGWLEHPVAMDTRSEIIDLFRLTEAEWITRGIGAGADADYLFATVSVYQNAHSAFWKALIEQGVVGLLLWLLLLAVLTRRSWRSPDRAYFALSAIPIFLFFYTLGPLNSNMLWVVFGLAMRVGGPAEGTLKWSRGESPSGSCSG